MIDLLSVSDVASELDLSERRVRALIGSGQLPAERVGRSWLVSRPAAERLSRSDRRGGRPLNASNAWALLALLAGEKPDWQRPDGLSRLRRHARDPAWISSAIRHSEARSDVLSLWVPDEDLEKIAGYPLVRSGLSAPLAVSRLNVIPRPDEPLDAYAGKELANEIVRAFAPEEAVDDPNLVLRIARVPWILRHAEAPLAVVASDLLDHDDARVRRAAEDALRNLASGG